MLDVGNRLPDLEVDLSDGRRLPLATFAGQWLVLYFYPKDNTPGCTLEALEFRELASAFRASGARILGVSRDSLKSHQNFCGKHDLPFALVSDPEETLCRAFDVMREKTLYGRRHIGIERSTFLIDPQQRIIKAWRRVKVAGHAQAVLNALREAS